MNSNLRYAPNSTSDQNTHHNLKTVLKIMKKYGTLSKISRRRKRKSLEQQIHRYENLLGLQSHANRPNAKWVTDIFYIQVEECTRYLSMIRY